MPYDLTGRSLSPVSDLLDVAEFPLADYLPVDQVARIFDELYYTEAYCAFDGPNLVLEARLAWEGELELAPPGCESFSLVIGSAGEGWTSVAAGIVLGPDLAMRLEGVTLGLRFAKSVLRDEATDEPAEIEISGDLSFSPDGIMLANGTGASLAPAYVGGTEIVVAAEDAWPVFGPFDPPDWLSDAAEFQGVTFDALAVTIPAKYLETDPGADLEIEMRRAAVGTTGFTGRAAVGEADLDHAVTGQLFGFDFRFRRFALEIVENALVEAALEADLHLDAFDSGSREKWVAVDVAFAADGDFSAVLAAAPQPEEAGTEPSALATMEYEGAVKLLVRGARITREGLLWAVYLSGALKILIAGAAEWPELEFDEIGVRSDGELLLPEGGGITFASPLVAEWHFARLVVPKFRFGRPEGEPDRLQVALCAEIALVEGLPAGASVEGLTVTWTPGGSADVSFTGIGVHFGIPGTFRAEIELSYTDEKGVVEFRGRGALELTALDMGIEIGVVVGYDRPAEFAFLYLFADAKLLPTGIPIAQTGLSIYGFQGLIAYNMALAVDSTAPADERYYDLFVKQLPVGITHLGKWRRSEGDNALGVGILLGTADKGFAFNVKGLLVIAFPDLTLLLQCKANFLKLKPDLSTESEGALDALLVYQAGAGALTFDVVAHWGMPKLVEVSGAARAYFNFTDPGAWYLRIGQDEDGERVTARALRWGSKWLFSAGFWFQLDGDGVATGILIEVALRASRGGFWVEASGRAYGEMALFWQPPQWEGELELSGRVAAGYRGLSIGVSLSGRAEARVYRPTEVRLKVEGCFRALFWKVCKSHTFRWQRSDPPQLESPLRPWSARPDLWTPELTAGNADAARLETGTVALVEKPEPTVPPHSVLSLDFAKPMNGGSRFSEWVSLPHQGYLTVGAQSDYSAKYELDRVALIRDPDGEAEELDLWGVWAQETPHPMTTLRLMSSERFAHEGSLSESFMDGVEMDYCAEPESEVFCMPVGDLAPGYGWLPDGSVYHWDTAGSGECGCGGAGDDHVLLPGERVTIFPARTAEGVVGRTGELREPSPDVPPEGLLRRWLSRFCEAPFCRAALLPLLALLGELWTLVLVLAGTLDAARGQSIALAAGVVAALLLVLLWYCRCRWREDSRTEEDAEIEAEGAPERWRWLCEMPLCRALPLPLLASLGAVLTLLLVRAGVLAARPGRWIALAAASVGALLLWGLWLCRCRWCEEEYEEGEPDAEFIPDRGPDGEIVIDRGHTGGRPIRELCYERGHGPPELVSETRRGGIVTTREEWSVPPEARILPPNETFELRVETTAWLKPPEGFPKGEEFPRTRRFRTSGPPAYPGALTNYVAGTNPADGQRPVYTGYDLAVRFRKDYVPYLYASVGQLLAIRLFDAAGHPVLDAAGEPLLVPVTRDGTVERTRAEQVWTTSVLRDRNRGCIARTIGAYPYPEEEALNTLAVAGVELARNAQYRAELVSDATPQTALASWTFTTSAYATFTELVSRGRRVARPRVVAARPAATEFDAAARELGLPTVAYVDRFTVTPCVTAGGAACVALVLESPEPLEFGLRLDVQVGPLSARVVPNVDETRAIAVPAGKSNWDAGPLQLTLWWLRDPGRGDELRRAVDGNTRPEVVEFTVDAGDS